MINADSDLALYSFNIITLPKNQCIEAYWSILRREKIGWWRKFFTDLTDLDMHENDPVLKGCIPFCFLPLIIKDLNAIKNDWNVRLISGSRNQGTRGRPDTILYLLHLFKSHNYGTVKNPTELNDMYGSIDSTMTDVSQEFQEFAREVLREIQIPSPCDDVFNALKMYTYLLQKIEEHS